MRILKISVLMYAFFAENRDILISWAHDGISPRKVIRIYLNLS